MRICIVGPIATCDVRHLLHDHDVPAPDGYGGAPLTAVLIGELLALGCEVVGITVDYRIGHRADPVVLRGPRFEFQVLGGRRRAWRFNGVLPGRALDLFRLERQRLAAAIRAAKPDVVHAHWTYEFALGAIDSGIVHVITAHDSPLKILKFTCSPYRALRLLMAREALRKATYLTAVSDHIAVEVSGLATVAAEVVPNPLAQQVISLGGPRAVVPQLRRIAMVCNGWGRLKNPQPALLAFAAYRANWPLAELHMFGANFGPNEAAQRWVKRHGMGGGMYFHGALTHGQLIEHLATMDVLLHPALEESFGVVLAEAMALGLPVVAGSSSGAVPWVVGASRQGCSDCAILVDVRDPHAIATALIEVFDVGYPARSRAGIALARIRYSASDVAKTYLGIYGVAIRRLAKSGPFQDVGATSPRSQERG